MIGAIAGDIIGSVHEYAGTKSTDFDLFHDDCMFTDDTVLTAAGKVRDAWARKRTASALGGPVRPTGARRGASRSRSRTA